MSTEYIQPRILSSVTATSSSSFTAPIVGRQRELTLMMSNYEAARNGLARVVLLSGEPGIGKTRLLDEIAKRASHNGTIVLRGGASEAEGMPPYLPFLEALGQHIRITPLDQLREQVAAAPQILASLLPELAIRLGDFPVSQPLPPEQARFRLYEAIRTFLEAIGAPHGLVLTLDDLHWADTASLDLLCHLARHQPNAHLLVLGAYRECEIDRNPVLAHTLTELSRQRMLATITVGPLAVAETCILAEGRLRGSLNAEVNMLLHTQSEGNPFFAEELLDNWLESGTLVQEQNRWVAIAPLDHTLPPSIVGALRQRFTRLSAESIDHLRVAAIIGRSFDLSLLATVQGQEMEVVEECLLEAAHTRLVQADHAGHFTFSHDKIRECLYVEVSTSRRRRLHELIGHILQTRYEDEKTMSVYQLAELAFHFAHSNDQERGIAYSQRAAAQALHMFAAEEAMVHYRTALELLGPDDRRHGNLLLGLGEAALLAGKEEEAEIPYEAAQGWLLQDDDQEALAKAAHGLGRAQWRQDKRAEARVALERALALLGDRHRAEVVEVLADLSVLLTVYMGQQDEGIAYARQALEMAQRLGDTRLEMMARRIMAENLSVRGSDLVSVVQFLEQALTRTEAHGDLSEAAEYSRNLAVGYYWTAEIRRSHETGVRGIALMGRCREPYHLRVTYTWLALLHASQGKWTEAEQMIGLAHPIVDHLASPILFGFLHQIHGFLAYQREDYAIAERELQAAMAMAEQDRQMGLGMIMFYLGLLGLVQAKMGKQEEARAHMARVEAHLNFLLDGTLPTAPLMMCLALTALVLGDQERAVQLYPRLLIFRGHYYWFLVDRVLGLLAALRGEWKTATMHLAEAEATARREDLRPELAHTLLAQAELERARGAQASTLRVREMLNQALVLFEELGMTDSLHRVHCQLRSRSLQPDAPTGPTLPANLTQREAEVLKLVAQGKSNRQIAQELGLTDKTVTNHLTHIFNKTSCENRAAATAFAIRNGLA